MYSGQAMIVGPAPVTCTVQSFRVSSAPALNAKMPNKNNTFFMQTGPVNEYHIPGGGRREMR